MANDHYKRIHNHHYDRHLIAITKHNDARCQMLMSVKLKQNSGKNFFFFLENGKRTLQLYAALWQHKLQIIKVTRKRVNGKKFLIKLSNFSTEIILTTTSTYV